MSWSNWLIVFIVVQIIHGFGTWKMYKAAGFESWKAFVPIYNAIVLTKIINRPWYYVLLLFLPIVNLIMFIVFWVETCRAFGYNKAKDTTLVIVTLGLYLYYLSYTQPLNHVQERSLKPRTAAGEWTSSILFAVVAATIVHTYVMQPFIIPTSSLEKSLLVGDFLLVSKFHYGARLPMTTIAAPMVHDSLPFIGVKSYAARPQLPYARIPGFTKIERNDIVVFNWPVDSINVYGANDGKYHYKPIDKKTNYVKRCVGIAGDTLSMVDGKVHINGKPLELPERAKIQHSYTLVTDGHRFNADQMLFDFDITDGVNYQQIAADKWLMRIKAATREAISKIEATGHVMEVIKQDKLPGPQYYPERKLIDGVITERYVPYVFPYTGIYNNTNNDRDPFLIPAKDQRITIDFKNIHYFKRIIEVYEGSEMGYFNQVSTEGNRVLLNNKPLTEYTFKQDYYWLMGDNRDNSLDSRFWGYVPESHVVGKPVFVWMSYDPNKSFPKGFRLDRLFTTVNGSGQPTSYLVYFLVGLGIYFGGMKFYKNRKKKK
jgi:signal peptidase I